MNIDRSQITQDIFSNLLRLKHLTGSLYRAYKSPDCSLTHTQAELIWRIISHPDVSTGQLAEWLGTTPSAVAQLVTPLEKRGFIERANRPNDRRVTLLRVTKQGQAEVEGIKAQAMQGLAGLMNHLSDQELDTLLQLELKIIEGTEKLLNKKEEAKNEHV
jgi:DNA-binding MarR family transcriptional regulator